MKLLYVILVLMSYCSLLCCGIQLFQRDLDLNQNQLLKKSDLVRNKIQNSAKKYQNEYKALPKDAVFTEINAAISNWDHHESDTQKSILAVLTKMVHVKKEYVEYLNKMFGNVNKARDNSLQKKLNEVTEESAPENNNSSKDILLEMISERNDWRTIRNVLKYILDKMSDLRENVSVTVPGNENNDTTHDQLVNDVITSYNKMAQEKLSEMNKNIESETYNKDLSNDQNIILELEDMIFDTTKFELNTKQLIAKTWRSLVQKGEKSFIIFHQQFDKSEEKHNKSVLEILNKIETYYINDDKKNIPPNDKILQKIDETITEANQIKTNDSILAILHKMDNLDAEDMEQRDKLITKVKNFTNTLTQEKLSKISNECNQNLPSLKYSINFILSEFYEMIPYVEMYDLETQNALVKTLHCVVQLVKKNHKQMGKLIKKSNQFIGEHVEKKLIEIQTIYSNTQTTLSHDDQVFQQLENMISELNEREINLDILASLETMGNLNEESLIKRNKLITKAEKCYNESIEMQLKELEVRGRDANYFTDVMADVLQELGDLISEHNSIPVDLHILKILDNLEIQFNDHYNETVRDSLTHKLIQIINKTAIQKFEDISKKYRDVKNFNLLLPNDEILDDLSMVITDVIETSMSHKVKDLLEIMKHKCTKETYEIISRLIEKNTSCFNKAVQRDINEVLRKIRKENDLHPEDIAFMKLTEFVLGIPYFRVNTIQLIFKTIRNVNSTDGQSLYQRELLMTNAKTKYLNFMENELYRLKKLHKKNPMSMLKDLEGLIVDINDVKANEIIMNYLLSMKISEEDIIKKRDQVISKVKEDNERYATKIIENWIKRVDERRFHDVSMDHNEFTELGELISVMHSLSRQTQGNIIQGLLTINGSASNRDELIRKWQEECKDEELQEKYAEKIDKHFAKPVNSREVLDPSPNGGPAK